MSGLMLSNHGQTLDESEEVASFLSMDFQQRSKWTNHLTQLRSRTCRTTTTKEHTRHQKPSSDILQTPPEHGT